MSPAKFPPAVEHVIQFFSFEHLPEPMRTAAAEFASLAVKIANAVPDDVETSVALRKLLEAKDAAVRAIVSRENRRKFYNGHPESLNGSTKTEEVSE